MVQAWQYLRECPVMGGPRASLHVSPQPVTRCRALFWLLAALSGLGVLQVQLGVQGENPSPPKAAIQDTLLCLALHVARAGAGGISGSMSTPSLSPAVEASRQLMLIMFSKLSPVRLPSTSVQKRVHAPNRLRCHFGKSIAVPSALVAAPGQLGLGCVFGAGAKAQGRSNAANPDGDWVPPHHLRRLKAPTGYMLVISLC